MPYTDPVTELVAARRDELERRDTQLAVQEKQIRQERDNIAEDLRKLQIAVEVYATFSPSGRLASSAAADTLPAGSGPLPLDGLKIADAAAIVMRARGGEARTADILRELQRSGRIAQGQNSYSTLFKTLSRDPKRFSKLDRGLWRLLEGPMQTA